MRLTPTVAVAGSTVTRSTGTGRVEIAEEPSLPCASAKIATGPPLATAFTRPVGLTVATAALALRHANVVTPFRAPAHE